MPYERSSPSHHIGILSVVRLLHLSEDAVTSNLYVNCPDFKTVCQMKQNFCVIWLMANQIMIPNIRHLLALLYCTTTVLKARGGRGTTE